MRKAASSSSSVGGITGMIDEAKQFVMLDDLPVMLTGLGILKQLSDI
jgi:hypothetical protein